MGIPFSESVRIRIYEHGTSCYGSPLDFCTREAASLLVERKLARWRMKGFAIQFREPPVKRSKHKKFIEIVIRGQSAQMGPGVTERAGDESEPGHELAQAAALSYLMTYAGSYCPLVPARG